jgi:hypothetical protein
MIEKDFQTVDKDFDNLHEAMDAITQFHLHREPDQVQDQLYNIMQSHFTFTSELFRNPWFKRVWILQEVINSKRAILHCGNDSILWKELIEFNNGQDHYVPQIWMHLGRLRNPSVFPSARITNEERLDIIQGLGIFDVVLEAL